MKKKKEEERKKLYEKYNKIFKKFINKNKKELHFIYGGNYKKNLSSYKTNEELLKETIEEIKEEKEKREKKRMLYYKQKKIKEGKAYGEDFLGEKPEDKEEEPEDKEEPEEKEGKPIKESDSCAWFTSLDDYLAYIKKNKLI